jgi:hypothetical protein
MKSYDEIKKLFDFVDNPNLRTMKLFNETFVKLII